jgi:hypothetical protein
MNRIQEAAFNPGPAVNVSVQEGENPSSGAFGGDTLPRSSITIWLVLGGILILVGLIGFAGYSLIGTTAHNGVPRAVPANQAAIDAVKGDSGVLHLFTPGDTWTSNFSVVSNDSSGNSNVGTGKYTETVEPGSRYGTSTFLMHWKIESTAAAGNASSSDYIYAKKQAGDRSVYLIAIKDLKTGKFVKEPQPLLESKGNWNLDRIYAPVDSTSDGIPAQVQETVEPAPVAVSLSNGTVVKCWNETITVIADGHFSEVKTGLFCPVIGAIVRGTDVVKDTTGKSTTTTTSLTSFSFAN